MEPNAILAINSLDRYTEANTSFFQPPKGPATTIKGPATTNYSLIAQYNNATPYCNDFQITTPGTLTYGIISKILVSQIQLQYNIPTVNAGLNDTLLIALYAPGNPGYVLYQIFIPTGFYTPNELAAVTEVKINNVPALGVYNFQVTYDQERNVFYFTNTDTEPFWFPTLEQIQVAFTGGFYKGFLDNILKTYKLFGLAGPNSLSNVRQYSFQRPNFLYTPYIEIYSNALTAYQKLSDGNSTVGRPKGLVARVHLSGQGAPQITEGNIALGSAPFVLTVDLSSPKVIRWTRDVAINSLDFQLIDCYGDLIPGVKIGYNTEFQMTLLCVEEE
jgi:hypothetical protein